MDNNQMFATEIFCLILLYSINIFFKLSRGYSTSKSLNPFFQKSKTQEFLELLEDVLKDRDGINGQRDVYRYEASYFLGNDKYMTDNQGVLKDRDENSVYLYTSKDSEDRELKYYIIKYENDLYMHIDVLQFFYKFNFDDLFNYKKSKSNITELIPGFWNVTVLEQNITKEKRIFKNRLMLKLYSFDNKLKHGLELSKLGIVRIKTKV